MNTLLTWEQKKEAKQLTIQDRKIFQCYDITIADESSMHRCSGRKVAVFENVFDIIDLAHHQIGHARDIRKNKGTVDSTWYGVPEQAVRVYLSLCPECQPASRIT